MLSEKALKIFKMKYALDEKESWEQACWRVANYVASAEKEELREGYAKDFYRIIYNRIFIPGGRILANAGTGIKNLMNCFVLPIEDSRLGIYETLKNAAEVFAHGGGLGYNFSDLREEGSSIQSTGGKASGPISFMSLFDQTGEVIQQASRRGAQIAFLDSNHLDIEKFINYKSTPNSRNQRLLDEYKRNLKLQGLKDDGHAYFKVLEKTLQDDQLSHFNVSVMVDDEFMKSILDNTSYQLKSRVGEDPKFISAKKLFRRMAEMAWESGDPGIGFHNRINADNMVPYLGDLKSSNPCGEIYLLPYESCCLGSINLHALYNPETNDIDYTFLEYVVRLAVRFLDDVQTISDMPIPEINRMSKGLRRLGLGVMGLADLLSEMGLAYGKEDSLKLSDHLSWFITYFGWLESISIAKEKGPFSFFDKDKVNLDHVLNILDRGPYKFTEEFLRDNGLRNVAITSIAPTGTIALLADINSGIEPFFALVYKRNITNGIGNTAKDFILEVNPILMKKLNDLGINEEELETIKKKIYRTGSIQNIPEIPEKLKSQFICSQEVSPEAHVAMQAIWQNHIDNSISKTINLPEDATVKDIENILLDAWTKNCKGVTVYRDKSKTFQILNVGK